MGVYWGVSTVYWGVNLSQKKSPVPITEGRNFLKNAENCGKHWDLQNIWKMHENFSLKSRPDEHAWNTNITFFEMNQPKSANVSAANRDCGGRPKILLIVARGVGCGKMTKKSRDRNEKNNQYFATGRCETCAQKVIQTLLLQHTCSDIWPPQPPGA